MAMGEIPVRPSGLSVGHQILPQRPAGWVVTFLGLLEPRLSCMRAAALGVVDSRSESSTSLRNLPECRLWRGRFGCANAVSSLPVSHEHEGGPIGWMGFIASERGDDPGRALAGVQLGHRLLQGLGLAEG